MIMGTPGGSRSASARSRESRHGHRSALGREADLDHVVRWSIMIKDGAPLYIDFAAFMEIWGRRPNPLALSVVMVSGFAVPGSLCGIEDLARCPALNCALSPFDKLRTAPSTSSGRRLSKREGCPSTGSGHRPITMSGG